jgi:predicted nucleic acid-binding protein
VSNSPIYIDAGLVIQYLVNPKNGKVQDRWRMCSSAGQAFAAPTLFRYEVTNGFFRYFVQRQLSYTAVERLTRAALALDIAYDNDVMSHMRAMDFARRFNRTASYDTHCLELAERLGIEFWTTDRRLYNSVSHHLPWVRLVGASTS